MKERLLSSAVGLLILGVVLCFFNSLMLNFAIALISLMAINEMLEAAGYVKNWPLWMTACCFAILIPFMGTNFIWNSLPVLGFGFVFVLFLIFLARHKEMNIEEIGFTFFISMLITFSLSTAIFMRDRYGEVIGMFCVLTALGASWMSDTGAFFTGKFFGKHQLAPTISPKKTQEGAVGGVVISTVSLLIIGYFYTILRNYTGQPVQVNYGRLLFFSPFLSIAGVFGDLSASAIKRQFKIKDFGNIMPGHGGVVDRFDSVLFVMPLVYILSQYFPFITAL